MHPRGRWLLLLLPTYLWLPRLLRSDERWISHFWIKKTSTLAFFENVRFDGESGVKSSIKGVQISLFEWKFGQLLEVPRSEIHYLDLNNKTDALKYVLERDDVANIKLVIANQLSVEMRLLHNIVAHIIFSKTGWHGWVAKRELAVMFHLIQGTPMNLPSMMLQHIKDMANRSKACLPNGMVFTLIFMDSQVILEGEDFKRLVHTNHFNIKSLHRMKIHKK